MALLPVLNLPDRKKLALLRRLDRFRRWDSLNDRRYCLSCEQLITGHEIQVVGGTRESGRLRLVCPTAHCRSIPMDWVLPTDKMLARVAMRATAPLPVFETEKPFSSRPGGTIRKSLRRLAAHFQRASSGNDAAVPSA